jgi:hypothetical protein
MSTYTQTSIESLLHSLDIQTPSQLFSSLAEVFNPPHRTKSQSLAQIDQRTMISRAGFRLHVDLISIDLQMRPFATHRDVQPQQPPPTQLDPPSPSSNLTLQHLQPRQQCPPLHMYLLPQHWNWQSSHATGVASLDTLAETAHCTMTSATWPPMKRMTWLKKPLQIVIRGRDNL